MTDQTPSLAGMLAFLEEHGPPPETRPEASTEALIDRYPTLAAVTAEQTQIPGPHGPIDARVYQTPESSTASGLVWLHGGGFVAGTLDQPEAHWVALSVAAAGIRVLSVDYRKVLNGVRYPVPSDDVLAAFLIAPDLLGDPTHLHIGGASAGANLAAGVAKRLRDGAGPLPAGLVLAYGLFHRDLPDYSDDLRVALMPVPEVDAFWREAVPAISLQFVGDEALLDDPYAFPANGDVTALPPAYLINSDRDPLRASGEAFARQLADSSIDVLVETEPDTAHGHLDQPLQPHGSRSIDRMVRWIRTREQQTR